MVKLDKSRVNNLEAKERRKEFVKSFKCLSVCFEKEA